MLRYIIFLVLLGFSSNLAKAAIGCAVGSTIYMSKKGSNYDKDGPTSTLSPGCFWIFTTNPGTPCSVNGNTGSGFLADSLQECPIDDEVWLMLITISGVGYFATRKRIQIQLIN